MPYQFLHSSLLGHPLKKSPSKPYQIIGGGIAGLLLAYQFQKKGIPFTLYEKEAQTGGILQTQQTPYGIAEGAANGVLWSPAFQQMVADIGLTPQLIPPNKITKNRYLLRNNELRRFPLHFSETSNALLNLFKTSTAPTPLNTIQDFAHQHLNKALGQQLLEPGLGGIYAAKLEELSFPAVLPALAKIQGNHTRLGLGLLKQAFTRTARAKAPKHLKGGSLSFKGGMQTLINGLANYLHKNIIYNTDGTQLNIHDPRQTNILCLPAHQAAHFFPNHPLAHLLKGVFYSPIISVTLFFKQADLTKFKPGFGCLIPRNEGYTILGTLFNHCIFEGRVNHPEHASLTCILRDFDGHLMANNNQQLLQIVLADLKRLLGLTNKPLHQVVYRWHQGIPLYSPKLYDAWFKMHQHLKKDFPNVRLFGNYTGQISIRKMCNETAKICAVF